MSISRESIIISTGGLFFLKMADIFKVVATAGYSGLELIIDLDPVATDPKTLLELINKYKLPITSVHMPMQSCNVFGKNTNKILSETLRLTRAVDAKTVVIHPWRVTDKSYTNSLTKTIKTNNNFQRVNCVVENLPKYVQGHSVPSKYYDPSLLASNASFLCLDTSHLATTKLNFLEAIESVLDQIRHVHLSDSNLYSPLDKSDAYTDDHLPPGSGKLPLAKVIRLLQENKYAGKFCIELRPYELKKLSKKELIEKLREHRLNTQSLGNSPIPQSSG